MHHRIPLGWLVAITAALIASPARTSDDREGWDTVVRLATATTLIGIHEEQYPGVDWPEEWTDLADIAQGMAEPFRAHLPLRDGWNRPFKVRRLGGEPSLLSRGPDGRLDFETPATSKAAEGEPDLGDDIVMVGSRRYGGPRSALSRQRQAMSDLRALGTAVESFSIDNEDYPEQPDGLLPIATIEKQLSPTYIRVLRATDPWGNPYLYWSNGARYVILSAGEGGSTDVHYPREDADQIPGAGPIKSPHHDIVFVNGQFTSWLAPGS